MFERIQKFIGKMRTGRPKSTPGIYTYRELAASRHPVDDFFASDGIDWIAVRASPKSAASAWTELKEMKSRRRNVADKSPALDDPRTHWAVYQFAGSSWTQLRLVQGGGLSSDQHLRELTRETGAEAILLYGRNDYDKCRALVSIHYVDGEPRETLLVGADNDQDLLLDHLGLDDTEAGEIDFEFEFEEAHELPKKFLERHGLTDRDLGGELARMDVLIR